LPRYQAELDIEAPREVVFDFIADLRRHSEWTQHRVELEAVQGGPGEGQRFLSVAHQMGLETRNELLVVESSRPSRFIFEASGKEGRFRHAFELQASAAGTRLKKTMEILDTRLVFKLTAPLFAVLGPRNMRKDLQRIRDRVTGNR